MSRDGPDTYIIRVIHYKTPNILEQVNQLKISNFHNHNLQQIYYLSNPRMFMKKIIYVLIQKKVNNYCQSFIIFKPNSLRTALTFQSSLNVNQLHFISRSAVLYRFCHS